MTIAFTDHSGHRAKKVVLWNSKGGSGKTSTGVQLSVELTERGEDVLYVDNDANNPAGTDVLVTDSEQIEQLGPEQTIRRAYERPHAGIEGLIRTAHLAFDSRDENGLARYNASLLRDLAPMRGWHPGQGRLDILPGDIGVNALLQGWRDQALTGQGSLRQVEGRLREALASAEQTYDWIFIDSPPALPGADLGMLNGLNAADYWLLPLSFQRTALKACIRDIDAVRDYNVERVRQGRAAIEFLGVVLFKYKPRLQSHQERRARYLGSRVLGPRCFETIIPSDDAVEEAQEYMVPPQLYSPDSPAAQALPQLVDEIVARCMAAAQVR